MIHRTLFLPQNIRKIEYYNQTILRAGSGEDKAVLWLKMLIPLFPPYPPRNSSPIPIKIYKDI